VIANYGGDQGFDSSTSPAVNVTVTQAATTTAVVSSSSSVVQGGQVLLTATVNTVSGGVAPSGNVPFFVNGSPLSAQGAISTYLTYGVGNIQTGSLLTAQLKVVGWFNLPLGQNNITAQYTGDANYVGSTSSATIVNVQADFAIAPAAPVVTISSPGGSGTLMLAVTGQSGYNSTINFTAASCSGLPNESTCSFNPAAVTGSGSTTVTVTTTAAHTAKLESPGWWGASLSMTLAGVLLLGGGSKRRWLGRLLSVLAFAFLITIGGCGGGGSSSSGGGGGGGNHDPGTPVGISTVTVTATGGSVTHTVTFTLNVQ
jgi:hypothetical protein